MTSHSRNPIFSSVGSNLEAIGRIVLSSAASNAQMSDAEMAAQIDSVLILDLWNEQPAIMIQETTNLLLTGRQANDPLVSGWDECFLAES